MIALFEGHPGYFLIKFLLSSIQECSVELVSGFVTRNLIGRERELNIQYFVFVNVLAPEIGYVCFRSVFISWEFRCEYA